MVQLPLPRFGKRRRFTTGPFPEWEELGKTDAERRRRSRAKVCAVQSEAEFINVHSSLSSGRANRLPDLTPSNPSICRPLRWSKGKWWEKES